MELSIENKSDVIKKVDIFQHLPESAISDLASKIKISDFKPGERIITKGEDGDCMYIVIDGKVQVHDGNIIVAVFGEGNYVGEFSLLDNEPRSMSVTATDKSTVGAIFQDDFYSVLHSDRNVSKNVITALITRLRERSKQIIRAMKEREAVLKELVDERTKELLQQKELVEYKNKEILDSIHYAKRHQDAILPSKSLIHSRFSESFVLYMQKDIVAGDFYWTSSVGDEHIIVAADCTGHGVAGALMSMLGISLLDQIVNKKGITQPSKILDELHESVVESLKQKQTDSSDGMDIAICKINFKENLVEYAGAYRPLWLIRNKEVKIVNPDKMPIGGLQMRGRAAYSNHQIPLQKDDVIYIFTDGYADQFGGVKNKKLMTRKFREMLVEIHEQSFKEQEIYLEGFFHTWRGSNEQIDDVLVIGIKI